LEESRKFYTELSNLIHFSQDPRNELGIRLDFQKTPEGQVSKVEQLFAKNGCKVTNKFWVDVRPQPVGSKFAAASEQTAKKTSGNLITMPKPKEPGTPEIPFKKAA
jgi:hypothetical protein